MRTEFTKETVVNTNEQTNGEVKKPMVEVVEELISSIHLHSGFDERLRGASRAAYCIDRMRREYAVQRHIAPVPFQRLVQALAALAGVSDEPVWATLGLERPVLPSLKSAQALGRLARLLDMTFDRISEPLRLAYAEMADPEGASMLWSAARGIPTAQPIDLEVLETHYTKDERDELEAVLRIVQQECEVR